MKKLEDYLHLYLGCEMYVFPADTITDGWLKGVLGSQPELQYKVPLTAQNLWQRIREGYKPILRPLSDMTSDELKEVAIANNEGEDVKDSDIKEALEQIKKLGIKAFSLDSSGNPTKVFELTRWLLSKGFDLFGLIEDGLAIDKNSF